MSKTDMVRAYTESLLKQILGVEQVFRDHDGDYPVRYKSAGFYIRIVDAGSLNLPVVQIFAIALDAIEATPNLLEQLNSINAGLSFARIFWVKGQVLVETERRGDELSLEGLDTACDTVGGAADYFGPQLAEKFGGKTAFADEEGPDYKTPSEPRFPGYL